MGSPKRPGAQSLGYLPNERGKLPSTLRGLGAKLNRGPDGIQVLERDNWVCQLCGVETPQSLRGTTDPQAPEVGHITPKICGGTDELENLRCECRSCNHLKGTLTDKELLSLLLKHAALENLQTPRSFRTGRKVGHFRIPNKRISDAIRVAQSNGTRIGRPPLDVDLDAVRELVFSGVKTREVGKQLNISYGLAYKLCHRVKRSRVAA